MKHCTVFRSGTNSIFLKEIAQAQTISLVLPEYQLIWDYPFETEHLLLLNTVVIVTHLSKELIKYSEWVHSIPTIEVMPKTKSYWERILKRKVEEIVL